MLKIILYILLAVIVTIGLFFAWFFVIYLKVPALTIPEESNETQSIQIVDQWFENLNSIGKFNGAVLISKNGEPLLVKGYGYADPDKKTKLTEHSSFQLASVSKQFTAAGIMILKEKEMLDYNDKITTYIPELPYKDVTIRHLLNQTSGIPDIYMELANKNKKDFKVLTNDIVVKLLGKEKRVVDFAPNDKYEYSNTNYVLLSYIIEQVSGKSYENFLKSALFDPLGMKNSRVWNLISKDSTFMNKTDDLERKNSKFVKLKPTYLDGVSGDGAVYTSVADMLIWDRFWYSNPIISKPNLEEAFKNVTLNDQQKSDYGFGWVLTKDGMWHNGSWLGANTIISRNTKKNTCLVILDNSSNVFIHKILEEIKKFENRL